ncbi:MAG: DNA cytosine methyltransferase, partial [Prevotella sp.]|nr:DNA cytosine methyltransferase [Prevotella sp.]
AKVNGDFIFPRILKALGEEYNILTNPDKLIHNTADYGVPQLRKRIIIIGARKDLVGLTIDDVYKSIKPSHWNPETPTSERKGKERFVDVKQAIGDLPPVKPGEDASTPTFNYPCDNDYLRKIGNKGIYPLLDHIARKHNDLDRERFRIMIANHWTFGQLRRNMPQYEHEHARVFDNSYVVQWWDMPSKTILAHIYKDGFQFIHPDILQARSFTVREAARIQSFPDDFVFMGNRSEKYKQIGNAVPPIFAEIIAKSLKEFLNDI